MFAEVVSTTWPTTTDRPATETIQPGEALVWTPAATERFILPRPVLDAYYTEIE